MNKIAKKTVSHHKEGFPQSSDSINASLPTHQVKKEPWKNIAYAVGGGFILGITVFFIVWLYIGSSVSAGHLYEIQLSPQEYFYSIKKGEQHYAVLDLRSRESYLKEHLKGAISMPVQITNSEIDEEAQILKAVKTVDRNKTIVLLGENSFSRKPYLVWKILEQYGFTRVLIMNAGWNEIRHLATFWLEENQWNTFQIDDQITQGNQ